MDEKTTEANQTNQTNQTNQANLAWKDSANRLWSTRIELRDVRRLKAHSGIDLFDARAFELAFADIEKQIEIIAELARPQWEQQQLSAESFMELLFETEDRFLEVGEAFTAAVADFCRRSGKRGVAVVVEKALNAAKRQEEKILQQVTDPKVDAMIETKLNQAAAAAQKELQRRLGDAFSPTQE